MIGPKVRLYRPRRQRCAGMGWAIDTVPIQTKLSIIRMNTQSAKPPPIFFPLTLKTPARLVPLRHPLGSSWRQNVDELWERKDRDLLDQWGWLGFGLGCTRINGMAEVRLSGWLGLQALGMGRLCASPQPGYIWTPDNISTQTTVLGSMTKLHGHWKCPKIPNGWVKVLTGYNVEIKGEQRRNANYRKV